MKRNVVETGDRRSIAERFSMWGERVAKVDFAGVREMFAEDTVAFGSKVEMVTTLDLLEAEQWREVWPTMEDYHYDLSTLEVIMPSGRILSKGNGSVTGLTPAGFATFIKRDYGDMHEAAKLAGLGKK